MGKVVLITSVYQWLNKLKAHCRPPAGPAFCPGFDLHTGITLCVSVLPGWLWFGEDEPSQVKTGEVGAPSFQQHQVPEPDPLIRAELHQWSHWLCTTGQLDQLPPCTHPVLKTKWEERFVGSHLRPWQSLEEDKNLPAEGFCNLLSLLAQHGKGLPWSWSLGFLWSHCKGHPLTWRTHGLDKWDRSGCSDGRLGKNLEVDVISTHESDPILSLQLAKSCGKEALG